MNKMHVMENFSSIGFKGWSRVPDTRGAWVHAKRIGIFCVKLVVDEDVRIEVKSLHPDVSTTLEPKLFSFKELGDYETVVNEFNKQVVFCCNLEGATVEGIKSYIPS